MAYPEPGSLEEEEELCIEEAHREGIEECPQKYERAGVTHLVHAWIQQGHPKGLLYPSRDMSRTSTGYLSVSNYYLETEATAREVGDRLEAAYPLYFKKYSQAFAAGVANVLDPGPYIGRALVWKMQVKVHQDGLDEGPAATFPCGYYSGGYLYIPQLGLKLSYRPGDLAIFMAGHLYHAVDEWAPTAVPSGAGVTPGRVSSVFFFPRHSFTKLEGRPRFWNMRTLTGSLFKSGSSTGV
ncbi:hypothetical protein FA13DRAFT_1650302 [Coprinellus micaceus]|uniref:Uncharacterized protein n=1 Tax=Coprinellus micaceus TaxID=71717 RepID=A0A4Y7S7K5_COPMI|nr:hypothetical protein FA13DRAFT_1650302 [Coprinellus micaceus]